MTLKEEILKYPKLFNKNGNLSSVHLRKTSKFMNSLLIVSVTERTSFLEENVIIYERLFCILNDLVKVPKCQECSNDVKFNTMPKGYYKYCSSKCVSSSKTVQDLKKTNCFKKHGVAHHSQTQEYKDKVKETNIERYGVEYYNNPEKAKATNIENIGVSHHSKLPKYKKYGIHNYSRTQECKDKVKETNIARYGVSHYSKTQEYKDKVKETSIEKYGVQNYSQTQEYKIRTKSTCKEKYGVDHFNQQHISKLTLARLKSKDWLLNEHVTEQKSLQQIAHELGDVRDTTIGRYFKNHNIEIHYYSNQSLPEKLLVQHILKMYNTEIVTNDRTIIKPKEIDIYLPEYNLAIEFNGIYWHRPEIYGGYNGWLNHHQEKEKLLSHKGIKLLQLWENHGDHHMLIDNAINGVINNDLSKIFKIFI